ncbi:hypothetical protein GCM10020254_71400 [Streptomyces goshikiensis]
MACATGRTAAWKRTSRAGSGARRETSREITSSPRIHSSPKNTVAGSAARKPTVGPASRSSPIRPSGESPVDTPNVLRAKSAAPVSASSHSSTSGPARASSSRGPATARLCSGRRKRDPAVSAPPRLTDSGSTDRLASAPARNPAPPDTSIEPPAAITTTAATTRGNAPSGSPAAPAYASPAEARAIITTKPATTATRASRQALAEPPEVSGRRPDSAVLTPPP